MAITVQILAEQYQSRRIIVAPHPGFDADDGFDPNSKRGFVELDQREQVAHIGNCYCGHSGSSDLLHQLFDADQPIYQRIFGVQAQMDERTTHACPSSSFACKAAATGPKERRCSGQGPQRRSASRWAAVG